MDGARLSAIRRASDVRFARRCSLCGTPMGRHYSSPDCYTGTGTPINEALFNESGVFIVDSIHLSLELRKGFNHSKLKALSSKLRAMK